VFGLQGIHRNWPYMYNSGPKQNFIINLRVGGTHSLMWECGEYTRLDSSIYMHTLCDITEMKYLYCLDNGIVRTYHVSPHPRCAVYRCYVLLQRCPPLVAVVFICALFVFTYPLARLLILTSHAEDWCKSSAHKSLQLIVLYFIEM
jgi:hypothetical protein